MKLSGFVKEDKLKVKVKPNSSKTEFVGYDEAHKAVKISVAAPPENNKANIALLKFVNRELGKKAVIKSGATSRTKILFFPK